MQPTHAPAPSVAPHGALVRVYRPRLHLAPRIRAARSATERADSAGLALAATYAARNATTGARGRYVARNALAAYRDALAAEASALASLASASVPVTEYCIYNPGAN